MHLRLAAIAACVVALAASYSAHATDTLTLRDAFQRAAEAHPKLQLFDARRDVLEAELERALLRPPLVGGASVENAFGSGAASGIEGAEITLSLASVLERGGKLDARVTLAQSRIDAQAVEREAQRLDLLAEVARRYIAIIAAQQQSTIAQTDIEQRGRTVAAAQRRHEAGAAPQSVVLSAQAALARAELDLARAKQQQAAARQFLAALWGDRAPSFEVAAGELLGLPHMADFAQLDDWLQQTPALEQFVDQRRILEARLQLARSESTTDVSWQVGVRRLQASDDFALIASLSIPLGGSDRARPDIRAARAELAALEIEREAKGLSIYSTLAEAHGRYRVASMEVKRLGTDIIPLLKNAEAAAARAYRAGAASYLEWTSLQAEQTRARRQQIEAAVEARRALIEIQRLTGQRFITEASAQSDAGQKP